MRGCAWRIEAAKPAGKCYRAPFAMSRAGKLVHENHSVLRWMAGNVSTETDEAGDWKRAKKKSTERDDRTGGRIMGVGRA